MRKIKEYKAIGSVDTCRAAVAKAKGKKVIVRSGEYGMNRREKRMLMKQVINQPSDTHMWIARIRKEKQMDIAVEMTRASVALATQRLKDNMIRIAEENWLPEHVRMLRALIVAADADMDYQLAYELVNERAGEEK